MILSEYQAKRETLEAKMRELNERESAHKIEIFGRHQAELKKIASQIASLKSRRAEENKKYEMEKAWTHRKYRDEKRGISQQMHMLRMEYLTVNNPSAVSQRDRGREVTISNNTTAGGSSATTDKKGGEL